MRLGQVALVDEFTKRGVSMTKVPVGQTQEELLRLRDSQPMDRALEQRSEVANAYMTGLHGR